jgi:hypothetical protein
MTTSKRLCKRPVSFQLRPNIRLQTDVPKSDAFCKSKNARLFDTPLKCGVGRPVKRRRFLTCLVLIGTGMIGILLVMPQPRVLFTLATLPAPTSLPVPVRGVPPKALADTWGAPRSGGRRHKGIDIFAKRGTEIIAPVSGVVLDIGRNRLGGNIVKILGPGPQVHYFAHLERFGLSESAVLFAAARSSATSATPATPGAHYPSSLRYLCASPSRHQSLQPPYEPFVIGRLAHPPLGFEL